MLERARNSIGSRVGAQTAGYFGGHVVLGLVSASLGPTLPALAARLATEPAELGLLFTARGLGYLLGSLACGRLYDRRPAHPLLVLAIAVMAAGMMAVPFASSSISLLVIMLVIGGAQALLDVGNNTSLVRVHGPKVAPFMNALHCFYGVGAMISPVVVDAAGGLVLAYWALAMAMLPVAAWVVLIPSPSLIPRPSPSSSPSESSERDDRRSVIGAFVLLFALCQSAEAGFGGWIYVVASSAGFSEGGSARLLSGFWAAFTAGRVLGIVAATRIEPKTMLGFDLLFSLLCLGLLVCVPGPQGLWVGTLGLGLALASVFPSALALAGRYVTLTGSVTSQIFVGASVGTTLMPWLIGHSFALGPQAPMLVLWIDLALASVVFMLIVTRLRPLA